jgi:aryl-alcohol dehydrogenase-like predicted oxidoreductase
VLGNDSVAAAIVGATRPGQVEENVRAASVRLGPDVVDAINSALADVAVR